MNVLIVAEKPSVALRIALSLGDGQPKRYNIQGVGYFEVQKGADTLYIVAAAGHLFSLHQKEKIHELPIFDIEWVPSYKINTGSYFTKKYLDVIMQIGKKCTYFINACDYDLEGSVIGTNIIKTVVNGEVNSGLDGSRVGRMKYSTTTTPDLIRSYEERESFDSNNYDAGEARHELDWMWGINMSRALMNALYASGTKKILSIGRVQGPALGILAARENEIAHFVPRPFWNLFIKVKGAELQNKRGNIEDKETAEKAMLDTGVGGAVVSAFEQKNELHAPFPPFDLTSLQLEASRVYRIDPSRTLKVAQALYERSHISYPRTSSQKLPATLNLKKVITDIGKNEAYAKHANALINSNRTRPHEGAKDDEAHPAVYPTGVMPKKLSEEEEKIYDLIVRRFLACFAEYYKGEKRSITVSAGGEEYYASGEVVKEQGWLPFYIHYKPKELEIPEFAVNSTVEIEDKYMREGKTEPPRRFGKASLIGLLEKKNLGTKATRASIIDTLFDRGYIRNSKIEVTDFGMSVYSALHNYCPEILDEEMTKKLDGDLDGISKNRIKKTDVVHEGKQIITDIIKEFESRKKEIGEELKKGLMESEKLDILGKCAKCGGNIIIKRSKIGKQFAGCSNWPACDNSFPLPQYAKVVPLNKMCDVCGTPRIKVFSKGKVYEMCIDPNCETKKDWGKKKEEKGSAKVVAGARGGVAVEKTAKAPMAPTKKGRRRAKTAKAAGEKPKAKGKKADAADANNS